MANLICVQGAKSAMSAMSARSAMSAMSAKGAMGAAVESYMMQPRMIQFDRDRTAKDLLQKIDRLFELSAGKIRSLEKSWMPSSGAPVFTRAGRYTARGWTEWTEGFQYGSALLQFDATGEPAFLELG